MGHRNLVGRQAGSQEQVHIDCSMEHFRRAVCKEMILEAADVAVAQQKVALVQTEMGHMHLRPMKMVCGCLEAEVVETSSAVLQPLEEGQPVAFRAVEQSMVQ